jgi:tetratricopeptide (TPR) repeat protein
MSAVIMDANEASEVLEQHVSTIQTCLETVSIDSPDDDIPSSKVSGQRAARYHKESDESGLGAAIEQLQKLLENTPEDHPEHLSYLWELGDARYQRYEQSEVSSDIDEAIMLYQNALEMVTDIAENSQHRARMFTSLADAYWLKMRDSQTMKILEVSIYWREKAVEAYQTLPDDTGPCKKQLRLLIDKGYFLRSEFTGSSIDLDKSIELCKRLLSLPGGHLERLEQLDRLGEIYDAKYNQTGAVTDYEMAIRFKEEALELITGDSVSREKRLASMSRSKWINSPKTLENVEERIRRLQATIAQTPNGHPDYQDHILELGRSFWLRYNETQAQADLEASIQQLTELSSTLIKKDATRVEAFRLLHEVYHARFLRTRSVSDIDLAIEWCHKTFHILPDEHRGRSKCLVDLATFWAAKYEQTKGKSDFDAAIHWSEHALGALPKNSYERAESLRSLGLIYYYRLGKTAAVSDADQ